MPKTLMEIHFKSGSWFRLRRFTRFDRKWQRAADLTRAALGAMGNNSAK